MKKGVILNNIGSPDAPDTKAVRRYLREFLMDPQVIELPYLLRFILVYFIITIFRAPQSAKKYQKIWTLQGSPLITITQSIAAKIQNYNSQLAVETGMQFQNPSLATALDGLLKKNPDLEQIYFIPMFPQYAQATTGASVKKFKFEFEKLKAINKKLPEIYMLKPFYDSDFFIDPYVAKIQQFDLLKYDALVFSYHGLPERAILKNPHCQLNEKCCETGMNKNCYRSQCLATTKAMLKKLNTPIKSFSTFQSRLGRGEWLRPYTDQKLVHLANSGVKRILVICPAFTVDCLETLEEIQIENKNLFLSAGGQTFDYINCLNDDDIWAQNLATIIEDGDRVDRL